MRNACLFMILALPILCVAWFNDPLSMEPIKPIPLSIELDQDRVALGKQLFHEKRMSGDNSVSCASCHNLAKAGTDLARVSEGVDGQLGDVNSPTVFNVAYNFRQFWDGRAATLEEQIDGPLENPKEMGTTWPEVIKKLSADQNYSRTFKEIYSDGITAKNIKNAIATFERSLITPNSRFDRYLRGEENAINAEEKKGYDLFKAYGCIACHQGANVGGNMFQIFGVLNNYFEKRGNPTEADLGRYNVTGNELDKHVFKVPSLRMAAVTPPYFHDGSAETLRDAVDVMFEFQLGREAPDEDKDAIVKFLHTLVGNYEEVTP